MAYNVLKGAVEGSVDQHADQEIDGVKVFKSTISASVFYDTDADSPCATLKDVAITTITAPQQHAVLTYGLNQTANAHPDLTFDGTTLKTNVVCAQKVVGSAASMRDIPHNKFTEPIRAANIHFGRGLKDVRGALQVKAAPGITISEEGVGVRVGASGGLKVARDHLTIDPHQTVSIQAGGQNLSDNDLLLVSDTSRGSLNHTTLKNLYDNYVNVKIPHPAGPIDAIQLKGKSGFTSSPHLAYDTIQNVLRVEGKTSTGTLHVDNSLTCGGAVITNVKKVMSETYEVEKDDYTILCDSFNNPVTITLPAACNHTGRMIVIKKINQRKDSLRSFPVAIKVEEGTMDISDTIVLKMNYSSRILQSDGENWWVIGTKGA